MTKTQETIFRYIFNFIQLNKHSPSNEEISNSTKIPLGTVNDNIFNLKTKGYIDYVYKKARTITILKVW